MKRDIPQYKKYLFFRKQIIELAPIVAVTYDGDTL